MEVIVRLAEVLDALAVVHQLGVGLQLLPGDGIAVSTQGVGLHQKTHLKHAVHVLFGDAGDHQTLFGQNGDQPLLLQTPQRIPHGGAADVAHLGAEFLLVQKLVGAVLAVQDFGFEVLVRLQLQAELCLCVLLFHKHILLFFFVFFSKKRSKTSEPAAQTHRCRFLLHVQPACIPAAIQPLYLIHYFTSGHFLQDFLLNFGVFSVLYKDYASILLLFTMFFVLVAKQADFPPASFASKGKLCYNRTKKTTHLHRKGPKLSWHEAMATTPAPGNSS